MDTKGDPPGMPRAGDRRTRGVSPAWLGRANTTLILVIFLVGMGFAFRMLSRRATEDLRVPGIYVRIRTEQGAIIEARAAPPPGRHMTGPSLTLETTLADVTSLARLIEDTSRVRIALPCPVAQRVSLRVHDAPVGDALAAIAAAANLHLLQRDGTFILSACAPP